MSARKEGEATCAIRYHRGLPLSPMESLAISLMYLSAGETECPEYDCVEMLRAFGLVPTQEDAQRLIYLVDEYHQDLVVDW